MKKEENIPVVTEGMMRKTMKMIRKHKKIPKIKNPFRCPICEVGTAEYSDSLCFDVVLSGEHIIIPNLSGHKCNACKEEFYDACSSRIIDRFTAEKIPTGHEATVSVTGGGRLGIYLPKDILRTMKNIRAKKKVLITPITKKKMIIELTA